MESFYPASTRPLSKSHPRSKPPPLEATAAGTRPTSHPTATHQPKNPAEGIQKSHHQGRSLPPQLPSLLRHGQQAPAGGTLARSLPPTCATPDKHTTPTRLPRHTPHPDAHHWHNLAHTSSKHPPNTAQTQPRGATAASAYNHRSSLRTEMHPEMAFYPHSKPILDRTRRKTSIRDKKIFYRLSPPKEERRPPARDTAT